MSIMHAMNVIHLIRIVVSPIFESSVSVPPEFHVLIVVLFLNFSVPFKDSFFFRIYIPFPRFSSELGLWLSLLELPIMLHVVVFPSLFVRKDLVGLVDSFELFLKALIEIRMVLLGERFIGTFDFFL